MQQVAFVPDNLALQTANYDRTPKSYSQSDQLLELAIPEGLELHDYRRFASAVRNLCGKRDRLLHELKYALVTPSIDDDIRAVVAINNFKDEVTAQLRLELGRRGDPTIPSLLLKTFYCTLLSILDSDTKHPGQARERISRKVTRLCNAIEKTASEVLPESMAHAVRIIEMTYSPGNHRDSLLRELEAINEGLTIKLDKVAPQEGFGRTIRVPELKQLLSHAGARNFLLEIGGTVVGYYLLFVGEPGPQDVMRAFESCRASGRFIDPHRSGWGYMVGITPEGRAKCSELGMNAYDLLHGAMLDTMDSLGVTKLFGVVREGAQANLAKSKHTQRGWRETGIEITHGTMPYQILELSIPSEISRVNAPQRLMSGGSRAERTPI